MSKRKSKRKYSVSGKVIDKTTNKAVSGLRVEAWDKDEVEDDLLGTATTNKKGVFSITFDDSKFADEIHDEAPDIYFKVYYSKRLILSTEKNVLWNVSKDIKDLKLQVVMPTKDVVKFEEKAPPAPVVKPSIKDSEDLPSTHEQPKDEAKPSPAPLSVTGVIRHHDGLPTLHHDGLPTLYVKKTELTVKLEPAVIKAATESHNIQISETMQQHITALMSVGVKDISKLGSISLEGNVTPSPGVLNCRPGSFSTSDLEEKSHMFSGVHKARMIGDATSQPIESPIDQVGGTATILKATPFPERLTTTAQRSVMDTDLPLDTTTAHSSEMDTDLPLHTPTAHRSVMDTDPPLHTTTDYRGVMDTDLPLHTTSISETGIRRRDPRRTPKTVKMIDLCYWAASEITIADNTTIILQQPHHWLFIIADKINIGTNVTFSWERKPLGIPRYGEAEPTKPKRDTPPTSTTMEPVHGRDGDPGKLGDPGYPGDDGPIVELWAKEINRLPSSILIGGQMGGKGGKGQRGQRGQRGARGRKWIQGYTKATCEHGPGDGGDGGTGGKGGKGGPGGSGGDGGRFDVFTLPEQIGIIKEQEVYFEYEGGLGGEPGDRGNRNNGGNGGNAGTDRSNVGCPTDYGRPGEDGDQGERGDPGEDGEGGKTQVEEILLHQISEDSFIERFNRAAIFDLSEDSATAGDTVEADGKNFSSTDTIYVNDDDGIAETTYKSNSLMEFIVPSVEGGSQKCVYVKTHGNKKSNCETITIVPKIEWIEQDGKKSNNINPIPRFTPGKKATIVGSGFTDDLRIYIGTASVPQVDIIYVDHDKVEFIMLRPDNVTPRAAGEIVTVKMILEDDIQSNTISIILDTFVIAVFGDSIQWGQGLQEHKKFHSIVSDHISNGLLGVYKKVHAHSGATIGLRNEEGEPLSVSDEHEEDAVHGEVPSRYPTVMQQLDMYSDATGNPCDIVDLILIDGGINDINIRNIINPLSDYDLVGKCQAICYEDMKDLLEKTLSLYEKAKIIVTGYYRPVTDDSALTKLILYFAGIGMIGGASVGGVSGAGSAGGVITGALSGAFAGGIISASQKGTIVSRCNTFADEANTNLQAAVDAVNVNEEQSGRNPRIFFAEPEFKDKNAIFADESWLWGIENDLGPADDDQIGGVETARQDACDDAGVDGVDGFMCKRASIGHPNVAGAEEYAKVIITELDKFYPEKP